MLYEVITSWDTMIGYAEDSSWVPRKRINNLTNTKETIAIGDCPDADGLSVYLYTGLPGHNGNPDYVSYRHNNSYNFV